ncbi:hypothetical protein IQ07DRAFT_288234 [Pyrenochaeta sp. DS3sAY3a]|nr:hypothetical protein IQ07DRAFT_288234 [Pyrenochaeta sp. DS3sAY3a]
MNFGSRTALTDDELIRRLSHRDRHILMSESMINIPARLANLNPVHLRNYSPSNLGNLNVLPVELLHIILHQLDFLSLFRLARVSHHGREMVHSLPAFRDLMTYAYPALVAFGMTELLHWHSCSTLRSALSSDSCVSCGLYGPFLFLPTCERCCYWCLSENQSLWLIPVSKAKTIFRLSAKDLKGVPTLHTLPGVYWVRRLNRRQKRFRLLSVKIVKKIAISIHGTEAAVEQLRYEKPCSRKDELLGRWMRKACLGPLIENPSKQPSRANKPNDMFCGMGSIRFPVLRPGNVVEEGYWCGGCRQILERHKNSPGLLRSVEHLIPEGVNPSRVLEGMAREARSRAQFLEHIKTCAGVERLVTQKWSLKSFNNINVDIIRTQDYQTLPVT